MHTGTFMNSGKLSAEIGSDTRGLDRVTITGADDSIDPSELVALSEEFPNTEWGILVSYTRFSYPRFPSLDWLNQLAVLGKQHNLKLSLHLCGRWLRSVLNGIVPTSLMPLLQPFQRIQLNFHGESPEVDLGGFPVALLELAGVEKREFIFQIDGNRGKEYMDLATGYNRGIRTSALFDLSHGAGILPGVWPHNLAGYDMASTYVGYAGGLGADNLAKQLPRIAAAAVGNHWVDMETKVRSSDDRHFLIHQVRRCLEIAKPFIKETE